MNKTAGLTSYVLENEDSIPTHLRGRAPFTLPNTELILRYPESDVIGDVGQVRMAGAAEFQTQITPGVLTDVCDPGEIYSPETRLTHRFRCVYDPEIQRGVKETDQGNKDFLRNPQIESMMTDIIENRFECPQLMWNLRASETTWVYVRNKKELRIYEGVATRPDTNHRHHAITNIHRKYLKWVRETDSTAMGEYKPQRGYGLVIYTDDFNGEAHRFYVYNFLGWRVSTSTAHYIESKTHAPQVHTKLARAFMESSGILGHRNVEILSNHLSRNSAKLITFGTLVEALKGAYSSLTEDVEDDVLSHLLRFIEELHKLRPNEIGLLSVAQRQRVRDSSVADQAVLWHGYIHLSARLRDVSPDHWQELLSALGNATSYVGANEQQYDGDIFSRKNPAWFDKGVIAPGKKGPRVVNNRQAREGAYEYLCEVVGIPSRSSLPI